MLVVDDQPDIVESLALGLTHLGYLVRTARDGLSGLETAVTFRPHIALIDLALPMIDGWELAERLRSHPVFRRPRLIALSGLGEPHHRARSLAAGFEEHLVKPVSLFALHSMLSSHREDRGALEAARP